MASVISGTLAGVVIVCVSACGANGVDSPITPGPIPIGSTPGADDQLLALTATCQSTLIIGQRAPCAAFARYASGRQPLVTFESSWSSSHPDVVGVDTVGVVTGRLAGEATISVSYRDRQATAAVGVTEEDALRVSSGQGSQGAFTPGSTVTMWLQGYYSVASAPTGRLSLRISDQNRIITTTAPMTVTRGGDAFFLSSTFVVPADSLEVCRAAVLEVGEVTIVEPQSRSFPMCLPIQR